MAGKDRRSAVAYWPGRNFGFGPMKALPTLIANDNVQKLPLTDEVHKVLEWFARKEKPVNFVAWYVRSPDEVEHEHGPNSREVCTSHSNNEKTGSSSARTRTLMFTPSFKHQTRKAVQELDRLLGLLKDGLSSLGIWEEVNVVLASDHGFATMLKKQPQVEKINTLDKSDVFVSWKNRQIYLLDKSRLSISQQEQMKYM
jgi:predicted AlkP superfamily pyrophosphatase or phosphodiesterase